MPKNMHPCITYNRSSQFSHVFSLGEWRIEAVSLHHDGAGRAAARGRRGHGGRAHVQPVARRVVQEVGVVVGGEWVRGVGAVQDVRVDDAARDHVGDRALVTRTPAHTVMVNID